jgi:acetyl-CoA synthetase
MTQTRLETVSTENRVFAPSADFSAQAHIKSMDEYKALYERSISEPEAFWAEVAGELDWFKPWDTVLDESKAPFFQWFKGGQTNLSHNCIDRNIALGHRNKAAIIWEGEPGEERVLTYQDLHREVCRFSNGLKALGIKKGDTVRWQCSPVRASGRFTR